MKFIKFLFLVLISNVCEAQSVLTYQVWEFSSPDVNLVDGNYTYENQDVVIVYNFWAENGDDIYSIYNKTENTIYIDYSKCHFIKGLDSYDYYTEDIHIEERQISNYNTRYTGMGSGFATQSGGNAYGVSSNSGKSKTSGVTETTTNIKKDKRMVEIPAKSKVFNSKFLISKKIYFDQYFLIDNSYKEPKSLDFQSDNSPFKFSIVICYSFSEKENYKCVTNKFYANKITNVNPRAFKGKKIEKKYFDEFGKVTNSWEDEFPYMKSNSFYIIKLKESKSCCGIF